jgi:hypothetical protein
MRPFSQRLSLVLNEAVPPGKYDANFGRVLLTPAHHALAGDIGFCQALSFPCSDGCDEAKMAEQVRESSVLATMGRSTYSLTTRTEDKI